MVCTPSRPSSAVVGEGTFRDIHQPRRLLHAHRSGPWLAHRCGGPGQTYLLPCGSLQLLAGAAGALGGMQQQNQFRQPLHPCSTSMQSAPCSSPAPCLVHSWPLSARFSSGVDTVWESFWQFANTTSSGSFARCSWKVPHSPVATAHPIRAPISGHSLTRCQPPHCFLTFPSVPPPHLAYTLDKEARVVAVRLAGNLFLAQVVMALCIALPACAAGCPHCHNRRQPCSFVTMLSGTALWPAQCVNNFYQALTPGRPCAELNVCLLRVCGFITLLYIAGPDPTGARSPQPSTKLPQTPLILP
jgi:hypothetical protein